MVYYQRVPKPLNLGSTDPSSHCGAVLLGAEEEGALHRGIQHNMLALFHSEHTSQHTVRAEDIGEFRPSYTRFSL